MWECAETFSDELGGTWLPNNEAFHELMSSHQRPIRKRLLSRGNCGSLRSAVRRRSSSPVDEPTHDYLSNWIELVHGYRSRHLTVSQDRPMAFAGVAQAFQAEHGLTYLAGLWAECLPSCLLWFTKHYDTRQYAKDSDEEDGSSLASDQEASQWMLGRRSQYLTAYLRGHGFPVLFSLRAIAILEATLLSIPGTRI
jgi:hypothetical protein